LKTGILLINLGTPEALTLSAVRKYLREFLSDPKVINLPWLIRIPLVNFIVCTRAKKSLEAYEKIWLKEGSPLLVYTRALQQALSEAMGDAYQVEIAMRYGKPSISHGFEALIKGRCDKLMIMPLFPQYSNAVTASILEAVSKELLKQKVNIPIHVKTHFYDLEAYIVASAELAGDSMKAIQAEYLLMSYHGLPERQMPLNPDYKKDCIATSDAIAKQLSLSQEQYQTSFQSRLGRIPWIQPYTDEVLIKLRQQGIKRLAVICPSFVVDCLETLEEIGIRAREQWIQLGGEELILVPCLNSNGDWIRALILH